MRGNLAKLGAGLKGPVFTSSSAPVIIVVSLFFAISGVLIFYILKLLRSSDTETVQKTKIKQPETIGDPLFGEPHNDEPKIEMIGECFEEKTPLPPTSSEETLSLQIKRLEEENANTREMYSRAVTRIDELKDEVRLAAQKHELALKTIESTEHSKNLAIEKCESMRMQLEQVLVEVEELHRSNANAASYHAAHNVLPGLEEAPKAATESPEIQSRLAQKDDEIRRLKELLHVCRDQILAFTTTYAIKEIRK